MLYMTLCSCSMREGAVPVLKNIRDEAIPWSEAKTIIASGKVESITTTHSGIVKILLKNGHHYYSIQEKEGLIHTVAREAKNFNEISWIVE